MYGTDYTNSHINTRTYYITRINIYLNIGTFHYDSYEIIFVSNNMKLMLSVISKANIYDFNVNSIYYVAHSFTILNDFQVRVLYIREYMCKSVTRGLYLIEYNS
jgi:hypothetical protein